MMPLFEKAGVDPRDLLRLVKLSELEGAYDLTELAADRQREVFDEIIAGGRQVPPRHKQDHTGMLRFAYGYLMGAVFRDLDPEIQKLIEDHVAQREQLEAADAAAATGTGVGASPMPGAAAPGQPAALQPGGTPPGPQTPGNAAALGAKLPVPAGGTGQQTTTSQGLQMQNQ